MLVHQAVAHRMSFELPCTFNRDDLIEIEGQLGMIHDAFEHLCVGVGEHRRWPAQRFDLHEHIGVFIKRAQ